MGGPSRARRLFSAGFGGLPAAFKVLWVGTLVNRAGTFVAPFLILYLTKHEHIAHAYVTPILIGYGAGVLFSGPIGGMLADRISRRHAMIIGMFSAACCQLALAAASSTALIALLVALLGLSSDLYRPAANAMIADIIPADDRPRAYGLLHWATNLGVPIASLGAGWFAGHDWQALFLVDAATTLVYAGLIAWRIPALPTALGKTEDQETHAGTPLWRNPALLACCGMSLVAFTIYFQNTYTVPLQVVDSGLRTFDYGLMIATNGVLVAVVQPVLGPVISRIPRAYALGTSLLLASAGIALTGIADNLLMLLCTVAVWSIGEIGLAALLPAMIAEMAHESVRGRYMGAFSASMGLAGVIAPVGVTLYQVNAAFLWTACAVIGVLLALSQGLLFKADVARPAPADRVPVGSAQ